MFNHPYSRREILVLLRSTAALGAASMIVPAFVSSCKEKSPSGEELSKPEEEIIPCPIGNLNDKEIAIRTNLKYTDKTPLHTRTCDNCKLYKIAQASSHCGGCSVVPGPIHPKGWCSSWYYRM